MSDTPSPGSPKAVERGCTCPVTDNNYGRGVRDDPEVFWIASQCPLHGIHAKEPSHD